MIIEEIKQINIEELKPFKDHPFKVLNDDKLLKIVQSIKENGVLIPPLLEMVDKKQIALTPAVEISYLTDEEQSYLLEGVKLNDCTPSLSQAQRLKRLSSENKLTSSVVVAICVCQ